MGGIVTRLGYLATLAVTLAVGPAWADGYPGRPVTVIVPYAAGGPSDIAIRSISDRFSQALGQPIVIENAAGGGGLTGTARAARAAPDGYTLLVHQNGLVIAAALNPNQSIDVAKELTAVGLLNLSYSFLVGSTDIPAKNIGELVAWMKGPGKPVKFAHPGIGSTAHLQAILFAKAAGVDATLIATYLGVVDRSRQDTGIRIWRAPALCGTAGGADTRRSGLPEP
jgi:tripartite-type tricarboxylate transporter receptor subunit TctC